MSAGASCFYLRLNNSVFVLTIAMIFGVFIISAFANTRIAGYLHGTVLGFSGVSALNLCALLTC